MQAANVLTGYFNREGDAQANMETGRASRDNITIINGQVYGNPNSTQYKQAEEEIRRAGSEAVRRRIEEDKALEEYSRQQGIKAIRRRMIEEGHIKE